MTVADETPQPGERADARRNRQLLLDAAASCIAEQGLSVAALDIAERAGVGVATLYRRFTSKEALIEQVILERFAVLEQAGTRALEDPNPWSGFAAFVHTLAAMVSENSGLSEALGSALPPAVAAGQERVRAAIQRLTERAQHAGALRPDISWQDIVFLPKAVLTNPQCLGLTAGERSWERTLTVLLDGLRTPRPSPLPGTPPTDG